MAGAIEDGDLLHVGRNGGDASDSTLSFGCRLAKYFGTAEVAVGEESWKGSRTEPMNWLTW